MNIRSPTFWIILALVIFATFAPIMYERLTLTPNVSEIARLLDPVAIATVLLAAATFLLVIDSSKNIEISKKNLLEGHLVKEMEELIKPLYKKRDELEYDEFVHAFNYGDAQKFWSSIEANKYLAPKELRISIENYLKINREWYQKFGEIQNKIRDAYFKEEIQVGFNIWDEFKHLPQSKKGNYIEYYELLVEKNTRPGSELRKGIEEYITLIKEDTALEPERSALRIKVINRYNELEKKIDEIRETLERSS